jgi:hypothetical protein
LTIQEKTSKLDGLGSQFPSEKGFNKKSLGHPGILFQGDSLFWDDAHEVDG